MTSSLKLLRCERAESDDEQRQEDKITASDTSTEASNSIRSGLIFKYFPLSIGLATFWRLPYLIHDATSPGLFLLLYFLLSLIFGIPLVYQDVFFGEHFIESKNTRSTFHSILNGVRLSAATTLFFVGAYFQIVIAWAFIYANSSFQTPLPWSYCAETVKYIDSVNTNNCASLGPESYFWFNKVLLVGEHIESPGFAAPASMSLVLSWIYVYVTILCKEKRVIKSNGKFSLIITVMALFVILLSFTRALFLPKASSGLFRLLPSKEEFQSLSTPADMWKDISSQLIFSLGIIFCGLVKAEPAYSGFSKGLVRRGVYVVLWNCFFTAIVAAIVLCTMAYKNHLDLDQSKGLNMNSTWLIRGQLGQMSEGPGVIFIVLSIHTTDAGPAGPWLSVFIFGTLVITGIHWQSENIIAMDNLLDKLVPRCTSKCRKGWLCIAGILAGVIFVRRSGVYWVEIFDTLVGPIVLLLLLALLCFLVILTWLKNRGIKVVKEILGKRLQLCYFLVTLMVPLLLIVLLVAYLGECVLHKPAYRLWGKSQEMFMHYPWYAVVVVVFVIMLCLVPVLSFSIWSHIGLRKERFSSIPMTQENKPPLSGNTVITDSYVLIGSDSVMQINGNSVRQKQS